MGPYPVNGKALPVMLAIACLIPSTIGIFGVGKMILEWDWAIRLDPGQVDRLPLAIHAAFAIAFILLGALQFSTSNLQGRPRWHRKLGRWAFIAGLAGALSGVWMTTQHLEISGPILFYSRLLFGLFWAAFLVLAVRSISLGNVTGHRAWMIRAYAIAVNAGTLPFVYLPWLILFGEPGATIDDLIQSLGWIINLTVAELIIRRPTRQNPHLPAKTA